MTTTPRAILIGLAALAGLALAGCGTPRGAEIAQLRTTPLDAHPITVSAVNERLEVRAPLAAQTLNGEDRQALEQFVRIYHDMGHGPIVVSLPSGGANAQAAVQVATDVRARLFAAGVDWEQIAGGMIEAAAGAEPPIVLSFQRYEAKPPPCKPMSDYNLTRTASNLAPGRFGCAQAANLAVMLADPADLKGPRPTTSSDAGRRDVVLGKYREGQPTSAERAEDERGSVRAGTRQ